MSKNLILDIISTVIMDLYTFIYFSILSALVSFKVLHMDQQHRQLQAAKGLHQRRLSSTPIKSPGQALKRCSSVCSTGGLSCKSTSVNAHLLVMERDDTLQDKLSIEVEGGQDSEREELHDNSDYEDQEMVVKSSLFPSTLCFPAQSDAPYDKRSYQDEESCRDSASDVTLDEDGESNSIITNADEVTVLEDKNEQQRHIVFDDDDTWHDLDDTPVGLPSDSTEVSPVSKTTANGVSPPERALLRKVSVNKVLEPNMATVDVLEPDPPPPASQLMTRLFSFLKPSAQNASLPPPPATSVAPESKKSEKNTGETIFFLL